MSIAHYKFPATQLSAESAEGLVDCPEISVWMSAFGCLRTVEELHQAYDQDLIKPKDCVESLYGCLIELTAAVDATQRFDVVVPVTSLPAVDRVARGIRMHVVYSPYFWRWYNWWADYLVELSDATRIKLYQLAMDRQLSALESYRPKGDWLHYRSTPAKGFAIN